MTDLMYPRNNGKAKTDNYRRWLRSSDTCKECGENVEYQMDTDGKAYGRRCLGCGERVNYPGGKVLR